MQYEIRQRPNFSIARITFDAPGEELVVEAAAMVAKDSAVTMKTSMRGGLLGAAKRKMLGGESLFQNTFTATRAGETIWVAPAAEGDMAAFDMDGQQPLYLSSGNYIASGPGITLDSQFQGLKGFFSGTSFFMLEAKGQGPLLIGSYGGIHPVQVGPAGYIVDNYHIVAFTGGLQYNVRRVGGLKSIFGGSEGLVCHFHGQGTVWISTRSAASLARFLHPYRPVESKS
ncbi:MAG: TIGR00266 family protein [bacterium]